MRRHNPPPDYIDRAEELEKLLRPMTIASFYAIFGIMFALLIWLVFAILVHGSYLSPTQPVMTAFIVIGCAPLSFALLALVVAPHDPVSSYISRLAKAWRRSIDVIPEECVFHELMADGEAVCFKICIVYPEKNHTQYVKERLYTYVNAALAKECSTRVTIPTESEVEQIIDPPLEIMATECGIAVMYSEVHEAFKMPGIYNGVSASIKEHWRTGTFQ